MTGRPVADLEPGDRFLADGVWWDAASVLRWDVGPLAAGVTVYARPHDTPDAPLTSMWFPNRTLEVGVEAARTP